MGIAKSSTIWPSTGKIVCPFTTRLFKRKETGISLACAEFTSALWAALTVLSRVPQIKRVFHTLLKTRDTLSEENLEVWSGLSPSW